MTKRAPFDGFWYYALWWCFWTTLLSFISYVEGNALSLRLVNAAAGLLMGLICATLFTLLQNTLNAGRRKAISWGLAIGSLIFVKGAAILIFLAAA